MADDPRQILGKRGEDLACDALVRRGWAILARRFRTRLGEIDIVARDGPTLVFVEVKARTGPAFGGAAAAVGPMKQHRVTRMAQEFLLRARLTDVPCRFDVVTVDLVDGEPVVEVYRHAFDAC